jgi:tetratricopeptide (TPR) repeat protein
MKATKKLTLLFTAVLFLSALPALYAQNREKEETSYQKGVRYFYQNKFEMAVILLQEAIKADPENALAYSYLGDIFLGKKRYDGAMDLYRKALDLKPGSAENHFRLGQVYYYKSLGNLSIESYQKAYELDSSLKFVKYQIGLSYLMLERDKENTIRYWEEYIRIAPEDPQYEKIKRVIELLKDPNFKLPPPGSEVSIEEALMLGGSTLTKTERKAEDKKAGDESKKTKEKYEGLYLDDL